MSELKIKTITGIKWSALETIMQQGMQFLLGIFIARLVTPEEYGLVAMLGIFISLSASFIDGGFFSALIQKQKRTECDVSMVFFFNLTVAIIFYAVLYFAAPYIAQFYNQPELINITRVLTLSLIINATAAIQRIRYAIIFDFKTTAIAAAIAVAISGALGLWLAYKDFGSWALVYQIIACSLINTLLLWVKSKWMPIFEFDWHSFKKLFSFGSKAFISTLLETLHQNIYSLVIGKYYSAQALGYFNRSNTIAKYPSITIMTTIMNVIYPAQCQLQHDKESLLNSFNKLLRLSTLTIFPLSVLFAALAYPLIELVLTEKWLPAAPILKLLSLAYALYPIMAANTSILKVLGRTDLLMRAEIIKKILAAGIIFATISFGLNWLAVGIFIYNILDIIVLIIHVKKILPTGFKAQLVQILPIMVAGAIMFGVIHLVLPLFQTPALQLICGGAVGGVAYITCVKILRVKELNEILQIIKRVFANR